MAWTSYRRLASAGLAAVLLTVSLCIALVARAATPDPSFLSASYDMSYHIGDSGTPKSDEDEQAVTGDTDRPMNDSVTTADGDVASTNNRVQISRDENAGGIISAVLRADVEGSATVGNPEGSLPAASSSVSARFDFFVEEEVAYTVAPTVSGSTTDTNDGCATAIVLLSGLDSGTSIYTTVNQSGAGCAGFPAGGSATGTLPTGRYRFTAVGIGGIDTDANNSAMYTASARGTITFGTGSSATCDGQQVTVTEGDSGPNTISGTGGADVINGLGADDTISGRQGNDRVCGSGGDDNLFGGGDELASDGKDRLFGAGGADTLFGGDKRDLLFGASGDDRELSGGPGNDLVNAGGGADKEVFGRGGKDELKGGGGNDVLRGNGGNDDLSGGPGANDRCLGGPGTDKADESCEIVKSVELLPLEPL